MITYFVLCHAGVHTPGYKSAFVHLADETGYESVLDDIWANWRSKHGGKWMSRATGLAVRRSDGHGWSSRHLEGVRIVLVAVDLRL